MNHCAPSGSTAYCRTYDVNGKCTGTSYTSGTCTPYVSSYNPVGSPLGGECGSAGCTPYVRETYYDGTPKEMGCCESGKEVARVKIGTLGSTPNGGIVNECVSSGYTAYCSSYDRDEKCTGVGTSSSSCTQYVESTYEDGTPRGGACCASGKEVQALITDGTTKVPNGGYVNYCVSSGYTAYCSYYDENGKCTGRSSESGTCTPYVKRTYEDGTPMSGSCCASGKAVARVKIGTLESTPNGGLVRECVGSGETAYCRGYDENGKCTRASSCEWGRLYERDGGVGCCGSDYKLETIGGTTRCTKDETCSSGYTSYQTASGKGCCRTSETYDYELGYFPEMFVYDVANGLEGCCYDYEEAYCSSYDSAGYCLSTSCCSGTLYVSEYWEDGNPKSVGCCSGSRSLDTLTEFDGVGGKLGLCHGSSYAAYCSSYNKNGKCISIGTTSSACTTPYVSEYWENGNPKHGDCHSSVCAPYVSATYEDGTPKTGGCCPSGYEVQSLGTPDGAYVNYCVSSGSNAYCSSYNKNGKCTSVNTSSSDCTPYVKEYWENGNPKSGSCSSGTCTPYVYEYYENGNPKSGGCCSGTPYVYSTYEDGTLMSGSCCASGKEVQALTTDGTTKVPNGGIVNTCVGSGYTAYCSYYDENGKCTGTSSESGTCTPYVSKTYEDGTPMSGSCCASGKEVQALTTDGTAKVSNGGYVNHCAPSGSTAYCYSYDESWKCTGVGYSSPSCTPYVSSYYENGNPKSGSCCSSFNTLTEFDAPNDGKVGVCDSPSSTAYCWKYDANGKCTAATTSLVKDCKPYRKSATEGACCAGTLIDGLSYPICSNRL